MISWLVGRIPEGIGGGGSPRVYGIAPLGVRGDFLDVLRGGGVRYAFVVLGFDFESEGGEEGGEVISLDHNDDGVGFEIVELPCRLVLE